MIEILLGEYLILQEPLLIRVLTSHIGRVNLEDKSLANLPLSIWSHQ